jgi:tRNA-guanine family transglycosylase
VSTNLPDVLTRAGLAMCIEVCEDKSTVLRKRQRSDDSLECNDDVRTTSTPNESKGSLLVLNVRNTVMQSDSMPLQDSCGCHACKNYSRAYLYHLFKAHELLGEVLLYGHNQWQLFELMRITREEISRGRFETWARHFVMIP